LANLHNFFLQKLVIPLFLEHLQPFMILYVISILVFVIMSLIIFDAMTLDTLKIRVYRVLVIGN